MDKTNDCGVCLPRASAFSPTLRIVAWSDTSSIRKKLMYGSETHLSDHHKSTSTTSSGAVSSTNNPPLPDRCNTPVSTKCTRSPDTTAATPHSHDITSSKSLRVRPQTIPYRSKSGSFSGRPCSAPPDHVIKAAAMYQSKVPLPSAGVPLSTLNLALPEHLPAAKPANAFQPKLPPKKKYPAWYNPECPNRVSPHSTSPGILIQNPSNPGSTPAAHNFPPDGPDFPARSHTEPEIARKRPEIKHRNAATSSSHGVQGGGAAGPKRDLHLSHRIAHLTQQINDCKQLSRASTIVIK